MNLENLSSPYWSAVYKETRADLRAVEVPGFILKTILSIAEIP